MSGNNWTMILISMLLLLGILAITDSTVKRSEHNECVQWAKQAQEFPKFYYTDWQKAQCGIK